MSSDWYSAESWYAPLKQEDAQNGKNAKKPEKKRTRLRVIGGMILVLTLIAATSLAFRGTETETVQPGSSSNGDMPENWTDFFDTYYETTVTDKVEINIERTALPVAYRAELHPAGDTELTLQEIYSSGTKSIVAISGYVDGKVGYNWGTGFILSADGLILTNTHVIEKCDRATVKLYDDTEYEAKLVGADATSDVAVLKIDAEGLTPVELGDSSQMNVGDRVAAIGNPLGEEFRMTLTDGIISAIERGINYNGHSMNLMQTNTALNEGNSGGPLFNMYGQVVGVTNMKMMSSYSSIEGIAFAIPSSTVRNVVNSLVEYGEVRGRTSIGITVGAIPEDAAAHYDLPVGLYISAVTENSDAAAKGIRTGDILLEVNGQAVSATDDVSAIKDGMSVGDTLVFKIWREGETFEVEVALMDTLDIYG